MGSFWVGLGRAAFKGVCFQTFPFFRYLWIGWGDENADIDDISICCVVCIE